MKNNFKSRASALLISFFLMSILILVGLGVSMIVFRDLASVRTILNGKMSAYAAEGMSELGLGIVKEHLPGYQPEIIEMTLSNDARGQLEIVARGDSLPCIVNDDDEEWRTLALNESIQIPLFYDEGENIQKITDFNVEYQMHDLTIPINGNVLRWKILGLDSDNKTEAISDYIAYPLLLNFDTTAKYYYYEDEHYVFNPQYQISSFLRDHTYNYLVLSNVVQGEDAEIDFKLTASVAVCEYVTLNSSSDYGDTQNGVTTKVKEGENLPVFDFALYNAKGKSVLPAAAANTPYLP